MDIHAVNMNFFLLEMAFRCWISWHVSVLNLCSSSGTHQIELVDTEHLLKSKVYNCKREMKHCEKDKL